MNRESGWLRAAGLGLMGLVGLSNGWSAVLLVVELARGYRGSATELLASGRRSG